VPALIVPLGPAPAVASSDAPVAHLEQGVAAAVEPVAVPPSELSAARRIEAQIPRPRVTPTSPGHGHRCEERKDLEFDHIEPYAKGGEATVGGIRLLCRAHNEAERAFGAEFMRHKRETARSLRPGGVRHGPEPPAGRRPFVYPAGAHCLPPPTPDPGRRSTGGDGHGR
jgi:HNH endonuclease